MTNDLGLPPSPDDAEAQAHPVPDDPHRRLAETVANLAEDPEYFVRVLANILRSMKSIRQHPMSKSEVRAFIESGGFTSKEWAEISVSVDRDSLQLGEAEDWVMSIFDTMSMEDAAAFLEWDEDFIQVAVAANQLYAVEISGRLRFSTFSVQCRRAHNPSAQTFRTDQRTQPVSMAARSRPDENPAPESRGDSAHVTRSMAPQRRRH